MLFVWMKSRFGAHRVARRVGWGLGIAMAWYAMVGGAPAAVVHLNSGREVIGEIDETVSNEQTVYLRTANDILVPIPRRNIDHIEQANPDASYAEKMGDLAVARDNLDRALELYERALAAEPDHPTLRRRIDEVKKKIQSRNRQAYGRQFAEIETALTQERYQDAIEGATELLYRVREASVKRRCRRLMAQGYIGIARDYRDYQKLARAEDYYTQATQACPDSAAAKLELAEMLQTQPARRDQAIPLYREGIALARQWPDSIEEGRLLSAQYQLAMLLFDAGQYNEAADLFLAVARTDHDLRFSKAIDLAIQAYRQIGQADTLAENQAHVVKNLQDIIKIKADDVWAHLLLGLIYYKEARWADARDMLLVTANYASPDEARQAFHEALYHLGRCHRELNELEDAARVFDRLLNQGAVNYEYKAACELADIRLDEADYPAALELFERAINIEGEKYRAYLGKGRTLQKMTQYAEARAAFGIVVDKDPTNYAAQLAITRTYRDEQEWNAVVDEAQQTVEQIMELTAEHPTGEAAEAIAEAYTLMGEANMSLQNLNVALDQLGKALQINPAGASAHHIMGLVYQKDGLHKDAETAFQKAILADPNNSDYQLSLGINWHTYRKSPEKALPYYLRYFELGGTDPNVRDWIRQCGGTPPPLPSTAPSEEASPPSENEDEAAL